jgi:Fe-S cluster assembly iron-binding protein IscA
VLTLTDAAVEAIRDLLATQSVPAGGGLRISAAAPAGGNGEPVYELAVVTGPESSDEVVERDGVFVYLEPAAISAFADKVLDAEQDEGSVSFEFLQVDA